jgi:hypothetical protein
MPPGDQTPLEVLTPENTRAHVCLNPATLMVFLPMEQQF